MNEEQIMEDFDNKFAPRYIKDIKIGEAITIPVELYEYLDLNVAIKSFISKALKSQQDRLVGEIEKMQPYTEDEEDTFFQTRDNIIALIKKTI